MQSSDQLNLGKGFRRHFEVAPATSPLMQEAVYRIRHEVYCEDLGFEPVREDGLERDEYDAHSLHCLIRTSVAPKRLVGCTRLVLPRPEAPDAPLPFEQTCDEVLNRSIVDPAKLPRGQIAEVSRLAVRGCFRRRRGEQSTPIALNDEDFDTSNHPRFPYIPISLYLSAIAMAAHHDIETLFVLTEPRLAQHFSRFGVRIRQIGTAMEHRGARVPSMLDVQGVIRNLRPLVRPIWEVVEEEIEAGYASACEDGPA